MKTLKVADFSIGENFPLVFICGPCVIESEDHALYTAEKLKKIFTPLPFPLIYKSSYDKANRSSIHSFRGPGLEKGLKILEKVKKEYDLPILTDVHTPEEARAASSISDLIQIPAFLSRQTDLIVAAAKTGKPLSIKKGQFMAPWDMKNVVDKCLEVGNDSLLLTERGTCFGYNNLVSDMRSIPIMKDLGFPVCFDASHSVQLPGGEGTSSGGERRFIPTLSRSAVAAGCNALYIEAHPTPETAKSDKMTVLSLDDLRALAEEFSMLHKTLPQLC